MLALLQNLNVVELVVIAVVAVIVFGPRLPEVARQSAVNLAKARRALLELRRQSGIDEELREARRSIAEIEREARAVTTGLANEVRAPVTPRRPPTAISRGTTAADETDVAADVADETVSGAADASATTAAAAPDAPSADAATPAESSEASEPR